MFGASPAVADHLREVARNAFAPPPEDSRHGLLSKLGPIFRRVPATPVISPTQPEPQDVEVLLAGAYVPPDRMGATWRLLETLVQGIAWGSTRMSLTEHSLTDLDFALARGGVSAAVGIRHLLENKASLNLIPVQGLTVGWHQHEKALAMAGAYRSGDAPDQDRGAARDDQRPGHLAGRVRPLGPGRLLAGPPGARPDRLLGELIVRARWYQSGTVQEWP